MKGINQKVRMQATWTWHRCKRMSKGKEIKVQ